MEIENFADITKSFNQIDIEDEPGSEKYNNYIPNPLQYNYKPQPTLRYIPPKYIDFQLYVKENCHNKIQILNRETFYQIKKPIIIFFNHFHEKCAYHTKLLDEMYELTLKYGDDIDFVAADIMDIDILYPGRNQLTFFTRAVGPEHQNTYIYAIDEKKRIHCHNDVYKTLENLNELCGNLLNGNLFLSLAIPQNTETNLIKICVHLNYEELVLKSTKNILLIANLNGYQYHKHEPNYENVASALKDHNLDVVYIEAEKNYIPFEYHINNCYPTLLFIPCKDKNNFIYYEGPLQENAIIEFLQNIIEEPEYLLLKQQQLRNRMLRKTVQVPSDFQIDFKDLPQFLQDNFDNDFKLLDRQMLINSKRYCYYFIIFMDFPNMKCLNHHIQWLDKIHPVAKRSFIYQFFIADFKDIDIINSNWKPSDLINSAQGNPKIYAFDFLKHTYEFGNFNTMSALFYFASSLESRQFYYSQKYSRRNLHEMVKEWTADYFNIFLKKTKKHTFITFYSSDDENSQKLLNLLDTIAADVKDLNVEVVKFDVKLNYVDLQYAQVTYPVHYFIPKYDKRDSRLYIDCDLNRDKMLKFIRNNVKF